MPSPRWHAHRQFLTESQKPPRPTRGLAGRIGLAGRDRRRGAWAVAPVAQNVSRVDPDRDRAPPWGRATAIKMAPWHHIDGVHVGSMMSITVKVDPQGRVVIPQTERERLGLSDGGALELVSTPEGVLLERRRRATVTVDESGLPLVTVDELETVSNATTVEAIHAQRDRE
ncbi:hypothetical protein ER308_02230 [Egibacter rhizosphaerae]|uniref:SpoVT-AbrB domain-containing protein n=2 Tax=Egibacter rhizosphaerae TaxID=1670831 RepID=A0A411YBC2_9ACTN|nr:hypothetical protein ER308_02230 [Egibacter rhizosphaerae]